MGYFILLVIGVALGFFATSGGEAPANATEVAKAGIDPIWWWVLGAVVTMVVAIVAVPMIAAAIGTPSKKKTQTEEKEKPTDIEKAIKEAVQKAEDKKESSRTEKAKQMFKKVTGSYLAHTAAVVLFLFTLNTAYPDLGVFKWLFDLNNWEYTIVLAAGIIWWIAARAPGLTLMLLATAAFWMYGVQDTTSERDTASSKPAVSAPQKVTVQKEQGPTTKSQAITVTFEGATVETPPGYLMKRFECSEGTIFGMKGPNIKKGAIVYDCASTERLKLTKAMLIGATFGFKAKNPGDTSTAEVVWDRQ